MRQLYTHNFNLCISISRIFCGRVLNILYLTTNFIKAQIWNRESISGVKTMY